MGFIHIGETIRMLRKERGISQEKLVAGLKGILTRESLSNIERGKNRTSFHVLDIIFDRLGAPAWNFFHHPLTDEEAAAVNMKSQFREAVAANNRNECKRLLGEMANMTIFNNELLQENLKCQATFILMPSSATPPPPPDYEKAEALLLQAIKITHSDFNIANIPRYLLTETDRLIISMLSETMFEQSKKDEAIEVLTQLAENARNNIFDAYERTRALSTILFNLSQRLGQTSLFEQSMTVAEEAIALNKKYRNYSINTPKLLYNIACCLKELDVDWRNNERIKQCLHDSYFGMRMFGRISDAEIIRAGAARRFDITLPI